MDAALRLSTPAPNPTSARATVSFAIRKASEASVALYNVLGQRVRILYEGTPEAGQAQTVEFSAEALPSGVYFVRLQTDGRTRTERLTVVR